MSSPGRSNSPPPLRPFVPHPTPSQLEAMSPPSPESSPSEASSESPPPSVDTLMQNILDEAARTTATPPSTSQQPPPTSPPPSPSKSSSSSHSSSGSLHSMNTTMNDLLDEAERSAAAPPPSTSQTPPPTLQELITKSSTPTHYQDDKLITNPTNQHHYKTGRVIGYTAGAGNGTIYNGIYLVNDAAEQENMDAFDLYVAMRVNELEPQEEHEKLVEQVTKNRQLISHPNVLIVREDITIEDQYWVVFDLMDKSLRCLMKNCSVYTHGLPLELVATALKEVLKALDYIHQQGHLHRELNAGHIYYTLYKPTIKIGFLATIYEPNLGHDGVDQQEYLPVSQICEWGAAPEIYHMTREYSVKSDVWLFGITAIELAFGSIEVKNRGELEMLINEVCENEDGSRRRGKGKKVVVMGKYLKKMAKKMRIGISGGRGSSSKRLSKSLKDMLTKCLIVNAEERPTAAALLQHDFFKDCDDDSSIDIYNFKKALESAKTE